METTKIVIKGDDEGMFMGFVVDANEADFILIKLIQRIYDAFRFFFGSMKTLTKVSKLCNQIYLNLLGL
jgi:hypothetical protein